LTPPAGSASAPSAAYSYATKQANTTTARAASGHERAERLLRGAPTDLHAGRDDMARAPVAGALGKVRAPGPRAVPPSPGPQSAAALRPAPQLNPAHVELPQPGMPRAGLPTYVPDPAREERDLVLKPMHDPYLGDAHRSTQSSTAGEQSLREALPDFTPMAPA